MTTNSAPTSNFQWKPEYDALLQKIASTNEIACSNWNELRQIIRQKLEQNVALFLTTTQPPSSPPPFVSAPSTSGGLRLPPFPPKKLSQMHLFDPPVNYMNKEQTKEATEQIFEQLDEFDENPPFTIQRLCELLLEPKKHYKSVGKYLRAVEKSVLVTSTHDSFPVLPPEEQPPVFLSNANNGSNANGNRISSANYRSGPPSPSTPAFAIRRSTPSTPLFSPIPFLHEDARRSRSRSKSRSPPPMTPLLLSAELGAGSAQASIAVTAAGDDVKAIGLVDELDDPNPGHMSDRPTPLTVAGGAKPFLGSLGDRFVKESAPDDGGQKENGKENGEEKVKEESSAQKLQPEEHKMDVENNGTKIAMKSNGDTTMEQGQETKMDLDVEDKENPAQTAT